MTVADIRDEDIICDWAPNGEGVRVTLVHLPSGTKVHGCALTLHMALIGARASLETEVISVLSREQLDNESQE